MFKPLRRAALALALISASLPAAAESLADAMVAAYRHSSLLDQNRAVLRAADEDVASAMAALRPVVQWVASYSWYDPNMDKKSTRTESSSLALQAQVTLYDFGRSQIAIDMAKESVLATRQALVNVEQNVLLQAVAAYLNVRSAAEQVALQANSVKVISRERGAAQDRFDVGEITRTDVALADARLAGIRAGLAAAEGKLAVAKENYVAATGKAPGKLSAPPALPKLPKTLAEAQKVAQRTHPAIKQAQRQAAAAELGVALAEAQRNPTLTGTAQFKRQSAPQTTLMGPGPHQTLDSAAVGVEMSQTLYSGGRLPAAHRKAMAQRDAARAGLLSVSRQVTQNVGTAWANIQVARAQIKAIDQQISAARQAYDGVREEAALGARTTLDVLDGEQSLLSAQADKISAQANLQLANYQLLAAMGLLTVEHLKLGIPTYDPAAYYNSVHDAPYTSRQGKSLDRVLRAIGKSK